MSFERKHVARVVLQCLREFWLPAVAAIVISYWANHKADYTLNWKAFGASFGATFFLICWGTGQVFRINKQSRIDDQFGKLEGRLGQLLEDFEGKTKNIINHLTGGDSYLRVILTPKGTQLEIFFYTWVISFWKTLVFVLWM